MKLIYFFIFYVMSISTFACDLEPQRRNMAEFLMHDKEFLEFVCGSVPCNLDQLQERIEFRSEVLRSNPKVIGCFVEPLRKARNYYIGVFVITSEGEPIPQFIFFGSGIGSVNKIVRGYRVIRGDELIEAGQKQNQLFIWNGQTYVEISMPKTKVLNHIHTVQ